MTTPEKINKNHQQRDAYVYVPQLTPEKVNKDHQQRDAYVYVRQSSLQQIYENKESTARQYQLKSRALELGWKPEQVIVIDEDLGESGSTTTLGESGSTTAYRTGFQRMVAEVGLGKVGVILGLEVSRLARNCSDWYRLLEICTITKTLIIDEDGIYDPTNFNDRLLLGLKGTMSEAETYVLRARLEGGKLNKAQRGELKIQLPVGLIYDLDARVQIDPDRQVRESVDHVFANFRRIGSAHGVVQYFKKMELRLPVRIHTGPTRGQLGWVDPTCTRILHMIRNPRYAGAFVYGRTRRRRGLHTQDRLPQEQWKVFIPEAHAGYITWDEYQANQEKLRQNSAISHKDGRRFPPREGPALLQGLVICGVCGKKMTLRYHQRREGLEPDYTCQNVQTEHGGKICQYIPGGCVDKAVGNIVLDALTPATLDVAIQVFDEMRQKEQEIHNLQKAKLERIRHEAEMARRQFMMVNPENRLVADSLEKEWNEQLHALQAAEHSYVDWSSKRVDVMKPETRQQILNLTKDLPTVWNAPRTSAKDKKRMLRLMIEDVTLIKAKSIEIKIRWKGGATSETTIPIPMNGWEAKRTPKEVLERIAEDAHVYTDREIADRLNRDGHVSGTGLSFTANRVRRIRSDHRIAGLADHLRKVGWLSAREAVQTLGISKTTLMNRRRKGIVESKLCADKTWVFNVTPENRPSLPSPN